MDKISFDYPTVLMVRHGSTKFNEGPGGGKLKGVTYDLPLTSGGRAEIQELAQKLKKYDIASVEGSDMLRARETMDILSKPLGVKPEIDRAFDPWDIGYLSGHQREQAGARIAYYIKHPSKAVPEGEPYGDWFSRFGDNLARELKEAQGEKSDGDYRGCVLVTHSCGMLATDAIVNDEEPRPHVGGMPKPSSVLMIQKRNGKWQLNENPDL